MSHMLKFKHTFQNIILGMEKIAIKLCQGFGPAPVAIADWWRFTIFS